MNNVLKIFTALAIIFILSSCEGNTTKEWTINNDTSQTIYVTGNDKVLSVSINESISAGDSKTILVTDMRGGTDQYQNPADHLDSLVIINSNSDSTTKDYMIEANWEILIDERSSIPSDYLHTYDFHVTDNDF